MAKPYDLWTLFFSTLTWSYDWHEGHSLLRRQIKQDKPPDIIKSYLGDCLNTKETFSQNATFTGRLGKDLIGINPLTDSAICKNFNTPKSFKLSDCEKDY